MVLLVLLKSWLAGGVKPNVPLAGWQKITRKFNFSFSGARESLRLFVFKKCGWEKNKKQRVGNECLPGGSKVVIQ